MSLMIDSTLVRLEQAGNESTFKADVLSAGTVLSSAPIIDDSDESFGFDLAVAGKGPTGRIPQLLPVGRCFKVKPRPKHNYVVPYTEWVRMVQVVRQGQCIVLRVSAMVTAVDASPGYCRFVDKTDPSDWLYLPSYDGLTQGTLSPAYSNIGSSYYPSGNRSLDFTHVWKVPQGVDGPRVIAFELAVGSLTLTELLIMGA
ncbi:hypothetical protein [Ferribacterium limneticum]|uniref:hypothetical protein n=1 Tax=Ferribacterium limneticum TaxID=76259 RepID=UPI001CF8AC94|nr:hypothetical protein [Ferribacterium limneticum]UCV26810.1 hypothetical protein KI617_10855 [Ferribacterium limneticum]UCV30727.1 hypothetical protein KI608_10855 [Ferribacterium limneticum]